MYAPTERFRLCRPTGRAHAGPAVLLAATTLLLLLVAAPQGQAAEATTADARLLSLLGHSETLMREGKFEEALAEMDRAALISPEASPTNLAGLQLLRGVALVLLDRPVEARAAFNLALCYDPAADPAVIDPSPATAKVFADVKKRPSCAGIIAPRSGPAAAPIATSTPPKDEGSSTLGKVLLVSGGAIVAAGGVLGIMALKAENDSSGASQANAQDLADKANSYALGADVCFVAGAVAAGTGLILLLTGGDDGGTAAREASPGARLLPFGPGGAGATLACSF